MAASEWLKDLQRAAQLTAQREQRGDQLTLGGDGKHAVNMQQKTGGNSDSNKRIRKPRNP